MAARSMSARAPNWRQRCNRGGEDSFEECPARACDDPEERGRYGHQLEWDHHGEAENLVECRWGLSLKSGRS
jgi:hypothetical protein